MDPDKVLPKGHRKDREAARKHLQWRFYQSKLRPEDVEAFVTSRIEGEAA